MQLPPLWFYLAAMSIEICFINLTDKDAGLYIIPVDLL
jgi:hypothetical protein